jgi:hypothetical protein
LKETYGMSDEQIRRSYQGGALRSAAGQLMVADAGNESSQKVRIAVTGESERSLKS